MRLPEGVKFFNPDREIDRHRSQLPHWQQAGATYFVTFRLADSVPGHLLAAWKEELDAWLVHHPEPWSPGVEQEYHQRFSRRMEAWLDEGHGECLLRRPDIAAIVETTLRTFDLGARYTHYAWVIMPNHVHVLFSSQAGHSLPDIVKSWKGVSARRINQMLGRQGALWMDDYFDRFVRDEQHFWNCALYIRRNPIKARLGENGFSLFEVEAVKLRMDAVTSG